MPENIGIGGPLFSDSNSTTHLVESFASPRFGPGTDLGGAIRSTPHSTLLTGRFFAFAALKPTALPEPLFDRGGAPAPTGTTAVAAAASAVAPGDHAASAAAENAPNIPEGESSVGQLGGADADTITPPSFRAAAVRIVKERLENRERRATAATTRKSRGVPAGIDVTRVPNLWLAVAHSSSLKAGKAMKVEVDGVPLALWRSATGSVTAMSDVCIHRGASLARGWVATDRLVCPCETLRQL